MNIYNIVSNKKNNMNGVITEIDNNIFQSMKNLSFAKYHKKIFDKMRNRNVTFKKIFSASNINPNLKDIEKKLRLKSKSSLRGNILSSEKKKMSDTASLFSKKLIMKNMVRSYYNKGMRKDDTSATSLSTLIKTNTSFFNTSNFNFNIDRKKLSMNMYNITNPNINSNKDKIDSTQNYFFTISFDKYMNDYLKEIKNYNKDFSCYKFLEEVRMMRKAKIINYEISKEISDLKDIEDEEINDLKRLEFKTKILQNYFLIYTKCLDDYLEELSYIKIKEKDHLQELKSENDNLKRIIYKKYISIMNLKEKIVNLKELKNFLLQVKFGKSLDQIPYEIKKEYGFYSEEQKVKEKHRQKERRGSKYIARNIISSDTFKRKLSTIISKKKSIKKSSVTAKNIHLNNKPIFDNPEQFMSCLNLKTQIIKDNLSRYRKIKTSVDKIKNDYEEILSENERYIKICIPEEERLLKNSIYQKKRNVILNQKLKYIIETNRTRQNSLKNIAMKLKKILLNIQSKLDIKQFIDEKNLEPFLFSQGDIFDNIDEISKITKYILKIIEMITEILINNRNIFKNNKKLKEFYRQVQIEIERNNNINRYKLQVKLAMKKKEEKNRNVFHKIVKMRLNTVFKNRKKCYEEKIPEKILLKRKLTSIKFKKYLNEYEEEKDFFTFA